MCLLLNQLLIMITMRFHSKCGVQNLVITIAASDIIFIMQTLVAFYITYLLLTGTQFMLTITLLMNAGLISKPYFKKEFPVLFLSILKNQNLKLTNIKFVKN